VATQRCLHLLDGNILYRLASDKRFEGAGPSGSRRKFARGTSPRLIDSEAVLKPSCSGQAATPTRPCSQWLRCTAFALALLFALVRPAEADVGIPMLTVTWPGMLLALAPVVLIEAWIVRSRLRLETRESLRVVFLANLASTIIGIPVAWLVLVFLEMVATGGGTAMGLDTPWRRFLAVTIQAPWLIPYKSDLYWMVPAATLALLPAYFLASWGIEYKAMQFLLRRRVVAVFDEPPQMPDKTVRRSAFYANAASYALLAAVTIAWLGISVIVTPRSQGDATGSRALKAQPPASAAQATPPVQITKQRVRIEFENPSRGIFTVEVRIGPRGCDLNPVLHTQQIGSDVGWALTAFAEVGESVCYRVSQGLVASQWSGWHVLDRIAGPIEVTEIHKVTLP
jgi:hypothetical protein